MSAAEELAVLFLRANTARHLVGISVGIGSNRRRTIFQIQLVMVLGDCRPGAGRGNESAIQQLVRDWRDWNRTADALELNCNARRRAPTVRTANWHPHQSCTRNDLTELNNAIERRRNRSKSAKLIGSLPLIIVWLPVRVLPHISGSARAFE